MAKPTTWVIIPTYNEADNIADIVSQVLEQPVNLGVLVVDDNSPDGTGALVDSLITQHPDRVAILKRSGKLGLGTAYLAGFDVAINQLNAMRIMTMDADFSHKPHYIPAMVALSETKHVVIGSRYVKGGGTQNWPKRRIWLSAVANFVARTLLGLEAHDTTAGFRLYHRDVLETLPLDQLFSSGYSFLVEMLFLCQRHGWQIGEVPIIFEDRRKGTTKIARHEIIKGMGTIFRLFFRRVRGKTPSYPAISINS